MELRKHAENSYAFNMLKSLPEGRPEIETGQIENYGQKILPI